uniref:NADH-ubiquinone oxidoreductase chain 4L n=1 Tax=Bradypus variegatus TaxID=9355 RepID=A0A0S2LLK0_BRAVA|nr:NADH dehydrogenase subunit 4L [Bradypus variegatus]ALO62235.1 NADH dehydrogenase subunit 4L [Bradypus variegatus]ATP84940.1 NADH dehydrogenase subunit 4L [Bradypus variegatus]ATP84949.1 NADH dehydrogenase subunit 4L [Bradypus variegatus]
MPFIYINILLALTTALLGLLLFRSHMMSSLLCLEGLMLSLFIMSALTTLGTHHTLSITMPIMLMVFAACETALGLALLVTISNTYGSDYVQNLNLLQC